LSKQSLLGYLRLTTLAQSVLQNLALLRTAQRANMKM
jgi:hypothetical protein